MTDLRELAGALRAIHKSPALSGHSLIKDVLVDIRQYMKDCAEHEIEGSEHTPYDLAAELVVTLDGTVGEYEELCPLCATDDCVHLVS